jgi:hypothetical protein
MKRTVALFWTNFDLESAPDAVNLSVHLASARERLPDASGGPGGACWATIQRIAGLPGITGVTS